MIALTPESLRLVLLVNLDPRGRFDAARVRAAVRGGVTLLQARGKGLPTHLLMEGAGALVETGHAVGVPVLVNDRPDVAVALGADGVHVGPDDLPPADARGVVGPLALGVSTRTPERVSLAEAAGATYLGVGAVRATPSKPEAAVLGIEGVAALAGRTRIPVVAIGGVIPADVPALRRAGIAGVAVLSGILGAQDPEAAARAYREAEAG